MCWFNELSVRDKMSVIKFKYPNARVRIYGFTSYVVDDGDYLNPLGDFAGTPERAIKKAYRMVQYN